MASVSTNSDSDEDLFYGPCTVEELRHLWKLKRIRRRALCPLDLKYVKVTY